MKQTLAIAITLTIAAGAAAAQTVGIAGMNRGLTAQASAAIAKVVTEKTGIRMRAQSFGGSSIYVPQISGGDIQFGLANELETHFAVTGTGIYDGRPQKNLRIAAVLMPFRVALFVRDDSDIKTLPDLKGKRVSSGWSSQKIILTLVNGQLANAGLTYDDVQKIPAATVNAAADDLATGKTDAFFHVLGAGKVKETNTKAELRVLPIDTTDMAMARMRRHVPPAYALDVSPSPANVGIKSTTPIMTYDFLVLTNSKVDDKTVYQVVKAMHENHPALKAAFPALTRFNPDRMSKNLKGVSLHSGAEKYYREIGQWPPK